MLGRERSERRPTVIFLDDDGWASFDQVAVMLRARGIRTVRAILTPAARADKLLREPHLRWLADRLFYDELIELRAASGRARLDALLASGAVADVIVTEPALLGLGLTTPLGKALTAGSLAFQGTPPEVMLDKFAVNVALQGAGVGCPRQRPAQSTSPELAAAQLGLPVVIKHPVGAGGDRVRVAACVAEIARFVAELGGDAEPLFYQEHVTGKVAVYGAVVGDRGPIIEHGFRIETQQYACGPAALTRLYDHPQLLAAGRRASEIFGPRGFVSFGFIEAEDGRFLHIDPNIRPWGMIAAPLPLGIDFAAAYADFIRNIEPSRRPSPADGGRTLPIYPHRLFEAALKGSVREYAASVAGLVALGAQGLGPAYCAYALGRALLLLARRARFARANRRRLRAERFRSPHAPLAVGRRQSADVRRKARSE